MASVLAADRLALARFGLGLALGDPHRPGHVEAAHEPILDDMDEPAQE